MKLVSPRFFLPGLTVALLAFGGLALAQGGSSFHLLATYKFGPAPGSTSEYFDYVTVDSAARRVYLGRGTAVQVMDADTGALVGYLEGFKRQHGVALATEFNRGFITDGTAGMVTIFDMTALRKVGEAKAQPDADAVVYDPATKRVFTMNGDSNSSTVIDAKTGNVIKNIELGGSPEFTVSDEKGTIFANLADKNMIAAIDANALSVKTKWPTAPAGEPTALAIDREHRRLFSAGRNPAMLIVMDADSGKVIQSFPISAGTDAAAYDPETGMIFVSTRAGNVHIFHEDSPDKFSEIDTVKTEVGAKTMGLDTKTHNIFLDTSDFAAPAAGAGGRRGPSAVMGTFRVLVYGK